MEEKNEYRVVCGAFFLNFGIEFLLFIILWNIIWLRNINERRWEDDGKLCKTNSIIK